MSNSELQHPYTALWDLINHYVASNPQLPGVGEILRHKQTILDRQTYRQTIQEYSAALHALGINPQTKVALLAQTSLRWHLIDLATMMMGAVTVPIYPTYLADQVAWHLAHAEASAIIIENDSQWKKFKAAYQATPGLSKLIKVAIFFKDLTPEQLGLAEFKTPPTFNIVSWSEFVELGKKNYQANPALVGQLYAQVKIEDLASIVYTSGTTGEPKGAMLTHRAFMAMLQNVHIHLGQGNFGPSDITFTFLPLSHVLGRCNSLIHLPLNLQNVFATNLGSIVADMAVVRPTLFIAVPRIFELIYERLLTTLETAPRWKQVMFNQGNRIMEKYFSYIDHHQKIPAHIDFAKRMADKLIFQKIKNIFGGRIRYFVTGGAPIALDLHKFLRHCGFPVLEGYGLTETAAPCFINRFDFPVPGSVGIPLADVKCHIDPDGEILLQTKSLFSGYYKNPTATAEVWRGEWFATGDIGFLDEYGCLHITDRKKDLIVTSGGKNVAPQMLENKLKGSRYISQAMVIGDNRKYLVAVLTLNIEALKPLSTVLKLSDEAFTPAVLSTTPAVQTLIQKEVAKINQHLASFEQIKKFYIAPEEFTTEAGHLTPSMKIKRKFVTQRYQKEIEQMYMLDLD